ncbi:hypothetical protein I302_105298 [Kwoniella bestiolae CBS 10118]|uniref:Uncharacterized protein n=1 Tax=Kwoniella bestiolae CBS 10118 TaxID=1296100 RepID=A0A1B9FSQ4_9TREE|nr:hypothetical protein I302_08586 [Kwoniella bestiolae CBS 10118]OCF21807.1 hypothetical protein I302_08586 [Kwoniella bestiolae CBS 10118]
MHSHETDTPLTPPQSYRSSPTPSMGSTASLSSTRSRSSFSISRYSPYPRVKVEREDEMEMLRDIREVRLEEYRRKMQKARSTSPYDELPTARPRPKLATMSSAAEMRKQRRHLSHRRAYSMSTISYGYFLFPSQRPSPSLSIQTPKPSPSSIRSSAKPKISIQSSSLPTRSMTPPTPKPSLGSPTLASPITRKLILVNPIVAHHLKHGGMVNIRSVDGQNYFKVCLPGMGGVEMVRSLATSTC